MWINFKLLESRGFTPNDLMLLQAIKQNKSDGLENVISSLGGDSEKIESFINAGLCKLVKGKKSDSVQKLVRTTPKGDEFLDDMTTAEVLEEDLILYEWLKGIYLKQGKEIGNMKKGKRLLAQFRAESGISKNNLAKLCTEFMKDPEEMKWSFRLEYLFFKAPNMFSVKFDLGESRLYSYYLKRRDYFTKIFEND